MLFLSHFICIKTQVLFSFAKGCKMTSLFFKQGEEIFHEGQASECAYIIESGTVEVSCLATSGQKKVLGGVKDARNLRRNGDDRHAASAPSGGAP